METTFNLKTPSFNPAISMPEKFIFNTSGCTGDNVSPALEWSGFPPETKSFAITVFDPDAPTGHGWWHWSIVNIPSNVTNLEEGASTNGTLPEGSVEGRNDYGMKGYGGACPPRGKPHRYVFTVYAIDVEKLEIDETTPGGEVQAKINEHLISKASFTVKYGR